MERACHPAPSTSALRCINQRRAITASPALRKSLSACAVQKKFYIRSKFGVGLISRPFLPLRLEILNIMPKHLARALPWMANGWRAGGKRWVKLAVCTQITLNVTEISAVLSQCDGVTGHQTNSTLHPPLVMSSDASLAAAATPVSSIQSGEFPPRSHRRDYTNGRKF